jgi:predicted DNA-binding ArsR family transcriptional regulator
MSRTYRELIAKLSRRYAKGNITENMVGKEDFKVLKVLKVMEKKAQSRWQTAYSKQRQENGEPQRPVEWETEPQGH